MPNNNKINVKINQGPVVKIRFFFYLLDKCDQINFPTFLYIDGTPIETGPTPTPVNCQWSNWGLCSETCGVGSQTRTIQVQAQNGGTECKGQNTQACNLKACSTSQFQSKSQHNR